MEYEFDTYGPFVLERKASELRPGALEKFWTEVEKKHPGLDVGIGVYIIGSRQKGRPVKPWYVGKTDRGFRRRFNQHARGKKVFPALSEAAPNGDLAVFLIARLTPNTNALKRRTIGRLNSIDALEFMLIGSCLSTNKRLLNAKKMSLHKGLVVPGYLNAKRGKPNASAKHLKNMLQNK
jgi:hypothetical protein